MQVLNLSEDSGALLRRGLDCVIGRLMLDRAGRDEAGQAETTATIDQAVTLKRRMAITADRALLVAVCDPDDQPLDLPGLAVVEAALADVFGTNGTPRVILDAIAGHRALICAALQQGQIA